MSGDIGKVYLVGAGPGDAELLTVKAKRLLENSDVIFHDSLVGDGVLDWIPENAEIHNVGKKPGGERTPQDKINRMMATQATNGKQVVRLKGGDPNVFGRGGEEAEYLASEGVVFEVVPGVSSAVAAPGVAGIPVTHREYSSSFTVVTGHEDPTKDKSALDWDSLASNVETGGTLVILMGVRRLPDNLDALLKNGVEDDTSTAIVQKSTWNDEFTVTGTLNNITEKVRNAGVDSPAVTVVGDVVDVHRNVADWLGGTASAAAEEKIEPRRNETLREHCRGEHTDSREGSVVDTEHSDTDYGVVTDRHAEVFDS
ncbi:uroporphyrinogen-III C-methyltransferase [Natronomonas marina]|jgi:uroporphyrin-III C-methyltransferase|uniref:uroporphyrinogen-III C-methyltransferase n=1 Tax=Natronomonas marina TaxID=2961939 RepID=UPI0033135096